MFFVIRALGIKIFFDWLVLGFFCFVSCFIAVHTPYNAFCILGLTSALFSVIMIGSSIIQIVEVVKHHRLHPARLKTSGYAASLGRKYTQPLFEDFRPIAGFCAYVGFIVYIQVLLEPYLPQPSNLVVIWFMSLLAVAIFAVFMRDLLEEGLDSLWDRIISG